MTTKKKTTKRSRPKRKGSGGSLFHSWWGVLLGVVLFAALLVALLWFFFVTPLSFRWQNAYDGKDYPDGYDVLGIDVSHYQERIDWNKVRNAKIGDHPVRFVIVKATEGTTLMDENLNENFYRSRENDLVRGAYHFFKSGSSARAQAEYYLKQVHLQEGDLPPILDVEERGNKPLKDFQRDVLTWLQLVEEAYGAVPVIYTGYKFKLDYLNDAAFDAYPLWIAHYYEKAVRYKGKWVFWQYTDRGRVDGIKGDVDLNVFNGDMKALMALTLQPSGEEPQEE
ncbi:MAG: glycoside hydrolase family 25 protein [Bacteroidaceae bacterium]|nr:glycoside hydrolase family 25 protein [Bacteroidaceae bacterium]